MVNIIQGRVSRCSISADAVLFTIVISGVICTNNRHCCVNRFNLLVTVRHHKGHMVEVRVVVHERGFGQTHVGLAVNISTFYHIRTACAGHHIGGEAEVVFGVQWRADIIHGISGHSVRLSVIVYCAGITMQRHRHINGFNRLITVGHLESHIREVVVSVGELRSSQTHICRTHICSSGNGIAREYEVCIVVGHIIN